MRQSYGIKFLCLSLLLFVVYPPARAQPQELRVAAAADLQFVFKELGERYEKQTGNTLKLSFGSSGNFFSQLQNGAPFDLFFSADTEYPRTLESAGLAEPGSFYEYARGKIVLWVPNDTPVDVTQGLKILLDPRIKKIAIANPSHAPYGRAAVAAFKTAGIYDNIFSKLVLGENISQAAQFVASGSADAGILALSLALSPAITSRGKYFMVPPDSYPPLNQAVIIMKSSPNKAQAKCFLQFLRSDGVVELMKQYGFELPPEEVPTNRPEQCLCCRRPNEH